jgi:hypothetical protein
MKVYEHNWHATARSAGLVWGPDYETRGTGFKSRRSVGIFEMNNNVCSQDIVYFIIIHITYMYDLCRFIRYLVSITQDLKNT